jgi:hypothetical protein
MEALFFKDGIYIFQNIEDSANVDKIIADEDCIYCQDGKNEDELVLYGGRVKVSNLYNRISYSHIYNSVYGAELYVDEIPIVEFTKFNDSLRYEIGCKIVSYLNAIETMGVDAFIKNYKESIEFLYHELKEQDGKLSDELNTSEDAKRKTVLQKIATIRDALLVVLSIFFSLKVHMIAGIENEKIIAVYQSIVEMYA